MNEVKIFNRPVFFILLKRLGFIVATLALMGLVYGYINHRFVTSFKIFNELMVDFLPSALISYSFSVIFLALILFTLSAGALYFYVQSFFSFEIDSNGVLGPARKGWFPSRNYVLFGEISYMGLDLLGTFVIKSSRLDLGMNFRLNRFDEFYLKKLIKEGMKANNKLIV